MPAITADHEAAVDIEERRVHAVEHVLFHPIRKSVVSVTGHSLQELDPQYGATIGEAAFDLAFLSDKPVAANAARLLEHLVPVGAHHVAAIFQSRCLVVWDLRDTVLQSVTEVEKQQKSVAALAASLCKDKWLFYASEGSNSIKVSAVDAREPPKKISRKAANRSSQLTSLAYHTPRRLLAAGASDGALQLWVFSEENTLGGSGKEEAALVTPLFAAQTTASPVVHIAFAACGSHAQLLLVAYQNRVVEVWDLAGNARQREPFRVAVLHCVPPHASDFAKKNGELSLHLDPQTPLLFVHWHAYLGAGSSAAAVEIRLGVGSNTTAPPTQSVSDWHEFVPASAPSHEDGSAVVVFGSQPAASPAVAYVSTHHTRQLLPLSVACQQLETVVDETAKLSLSAASQLGVEQYFKYHDVPATLVQIARCTDESSASSGNVIPCQLQRFSQTSGEIEKLDDLPVWNNYQGRQLVPWKLECNEQQSAVCVHLRDPSKSHATDDDAGVTYVLLELKAKAKAMSDGDGDGGSSGGASSVHVTCGTPMDALDVCFCDLRTDEAKQTRPYVMLALASTGKSIGFQMNCDQVDQTSRVLLQQAVRRIFPTPIALSASSTYASLVGSRLLYLVPSSGGDSATMTHHSLVLSEDDLSVPRNLSSGFQTRSNGERVLDVIWNAGASQSTLSSADRSTNMLAAVRTTQRVVILSASPPSTSLAVVAEYDLVRDLGSPQSLLWMAQTLLVVTSDQHVRFVTPLVPAKSGSSTTHLLCSLPSDLLGPQKTQLLSVCSDRLCYAVQDPRSLECRTYLRPIAVCEPLLLGFREPTDGRLKAIFERDVLVFLSTGGAETRNPVTERLLDVLYHDFGWTDTVTKVLDAMLNPSTGAAASLAIAGGTAGASGGSFKKVTHLPASLVSSLLLHSQKWKDAVRVHLINDPALEEYALADDDGLGSSSAKLPSRTGATSSRFQWLAAVLASVGQAELAIKCLDVAGDDIAIVELLRKHGLDPTAAESVLNALQKDWAQLNPSLAAITKATTATDSTATQRHDLFSLLCCEQLNQTERRSRLLATVRPLDKLNMKTTQNEPAKEKPPLTASGRAGILYWKRLSPEDAKDAIGFSSTPHFSTDEPKNPTSNAIFHGSGGGSSLLSTGTSGAGEDPAVAASTGDAAAQSGSDAAAKMTIGPFLEDEDAVVAYWRFEEGSTASGDDTKRTLDSMDTTKRENHLQILQFGSVMTFATSSAPVDKGEEGKLQEAFSLRFPSAEAGPVDEWGAKCAVRPGSTLDIGLVFDEDPYRRKFTFEAWIRNFVLFRKKQVAEEDGGDGDDFSADRSMAAWTDDASVRRLVCRRGVDKSTWWEFGLCDGGALFLTFGGHTLKADEKITNAAAWQHVAFTIDITSPKHATLKLFLQARCVATKEVSTVDSNAKLLSAATKALAAMGPDPSGGLPPPPSTLHLGHELTDYEMTELRVWANARTAEQLSDMKENYLGIAETKRRMKITIHQRNCQCEKCLGRRTVKPAAGKGALLGAPLFPSTPPPAAGSARDRRRPQPKA